MKVKNLNRSSAKTKKIIKETFAQLIKEEKELCKITVSELVKRADINRSTFYNHYDSIYSVAEEIESEVIKILIQDDKQLTSFTDIFRYFDTIIEYLKKNENTYKLFLSSKEPLLFLDKLKKELSQKLYLVLKKVNNIPDLQFYISFYTDGMLNQILKYFTSTSEYSLDDIDNLMKDIFVKIFAKGL